MKILLIFNPYAGHKRAQKILPEVESLLAQNNIDYDLYLTEYPEHGIELVSRANFEKYDGLVAGGGDGTLFEVINGYYKNRSKTRIPLGVLPIGTGNAFARDLDLDATRWRTAGQYSRGNRMSAAGDRSVLEIIAFFFIKICFHDHKS